MVPDWQTNCIYFSALLGKRRPEVWSSLQSVLRRTKTACGTLHGTKEIWCRDFMPAQVANESFCQFTYDPDYLRDARRLITPAAACPPCTITKCRKVGLVVDRGNIVSAVSKVILTNKVYKENPGKNWREIRRVLEDSLQAECIIIPLPPGDPIGHADDVVRFLDEDTVLVNDFRDVEAGYGRRLRAVLHGHGLECVPVPYFFEDRVTDGIPSAAGCYINYLRTEKLLILPVFGLKRDETAIRAFKSLFRGTRVIPVRCTELSREGGCLNCISWTIREKGAEKIGDLLTYHSHMESATSEGRSVVAEAGAAADPPPYLNA
jgi:agmatine deiminase